MKRKGVIENELICSKIKTRDQLKKSNTYSSDFSLEDFKELCNELDAQYHKKAKKVDNSAKQIEAIAKIEEYGGYMLDNGMVVSPQWCRDYIEAIDAWLNWETEQIMKGTGAGNFEVKSKTKK